MLQIRPMVWRLLSRISVGCRAAAGRTIPARPTQPPMSCTFRRARHGANGPPSPPPALHPAVRRAGPPAGRIDRRLPLQSRCRARLGSESATWCMLQPIAPWEPSESTQICWACCSGSLPNAMRLLKNLCPDRDKQVGLQVVGCRMVRKGYILFYPLRTTSCGDRARRLQRFLWIVARIV